MSAAIARRPEGRLALLRRLRRNREGVAAVEWAFVAPVFLMIILGAFDEGFAIYTQTALKGAVEEGARQASLENTQWNDITTRVNKQVRNVIPVGDPNTEITFTLDPTVYQSYNELQMGEHFVDRERAPFTKNNAYDGDEAFTDSNGNEIWDPGETFTDKNRGVKNGTRDSDECFTDQNGNKVWDSNIGVTGRGSGQDVVSIKASVVYKRIFPFWKMIGQPQTQTLTATTALRNQPFSAQSQRTGVTICPT